MIIAGLITIPLFTALLIWLLRGRALRTLLIAGAVLHLALTAAAFFAGADTFNFCGIFLGFSRTGFSAVVLGITSVLFFITALHIALWLEVDANAGKIRGGHTGMKKQSFAALLLLFLGTMTLTAVAQDFGMLWVAVEATTLASAPLINFHKSKSSLEAMWKYLLLCSLGIGLALFGTMLLSAALPENSTLAFGAIKDVDPQWFKAAFVFCFAGYGLKTGLAPFHSWLPDAHSEAPAPVSALLSGSLLNCALLGILRIKAAAPANLAEFCNGFFIFFGLFSLIIAAFFIIRQKDFKRMLAYSSVEHMGLIVLMIGFGCSATYFHAVFHSLTKMMLFLTAGNLLLAYGTRKINAVQGIFTRMPRNGAAWMIGMLLICGTPPSPLFFTELALVQNAGLLYGGIILLLLLIIFCAMSYPVIKMCTGDADTPEIPAIDRDAEKLAVMPLAITALIIACGLIYCAAIFGLLA